MTTKEAILGALNDLHRAQDYVIETYDNQSKDTRFPPNVRQQLSECLTQHYRHREKLEQAITELGGEVPRATAVLTSWLSSLKELTSSSMENYQLLHNDLIAERGLVDGYKVLIELAHGFPGVTLMAQDNMQETERLAQFLETAALDSARQMRAA